MTPRSPANSPTCPYPPAADTTTTTTKHAILPHVVYGILAGIPVCLFALTFPRLLFPAAATRTYLPSTGYAYQAELSHFDNTAWTYGSDYAIGMAMMVLVYSFPKHNNPRGPSSILLRIQLQRLSQGLLLCYANSVVWGGIGHQFYVTLDMRHTWHFRLLWTLTVGCVAAAGGVMGAVASLLVVVVAAHNNHPNNHRNNHLPVISPWFWAGIGMSTTTATVLGYFSFQRPACDIFVAGTSQFPSTVYMMAVILSSCGTTTRHRMCGMIGFGLMSLTLPSYTLAVQYSDLSMGVINLLLHVCLLTAWTLQGWTLRQICVSMQRQESPITTTTRSDKKSYGTMPLVTPHSETSFS